MQAGAKPPGVIHAALFGSQARGDGGPNSDIDIMVELDQDVQISLYDYVAITNVIKDEFGKDRKVDVVNRQGLHFLVKPNVEKDACYAF